MARERGDDGWMADTLTLAAHATRAANPAVDLDAIEALTRQGAGECDIAQATGLSLQTIQKRLRQALSEGRIKPSVAEAAAKLPADYQSELFDHAVEELTAMRQASRRRSARHEGCRLSGSGRVVG